MDEVDGEAGLFIKDLDTGKKFLLSATDSSEVVNDTEAGTKLTLDQFHAEIGILTPLKTRGSGSTTCSDVGSPQSEASPPDQNLGLQPPRMIRKSLAKIKSFERRSHSKDQQTAAHRPRHSFSPMSSTPASPMAWLGKSVKGNMNPETMKVTAARRVRRELTDVRLVQEIKQHQGQVWVMKFSPNGEYLATGGKDAVIFLWQVVKERGKSDDNAYQTKLPVLEMEPSRTWQSHKADVLDLAWSSASELVLSASLDKTVRLWTITQDACLREIPHQTWVTSVRFHPREPSKFVSGCGDGQLRLWDLMGRKVIGSTSIAGEKDLFTALSFNNDGRMILAGSYKGKCRLYQVMERKIEIKAEIDVRNRRGRHARGKKVTSVEFSSIDGQPWFLVTTCDSRIRLLQGATSAPSEVAKFKGHTNESGRPVGASSSPRGDYVICGSDDGRVFVWPCSQGEATTSPREGYRMIAGREKVSSNENFLAHNGYTTSAIFAPETCRRPFTCLEQGTEDSLRLDRQSLSQKDRKSFHSSTEHVDFKDLKLWGQVMVTAGHGGEIKIWENFGLPVSTC